MQDSIKQRVFLHRIIVQSWIKSPSVEVEKKQSSQERRRGSAKCIKSKKIENDFFLDRTLLDEMPKRDPRRKMRHFYMAFDLKHSSLFSET